ncbi:Sterol uptake control protein [Lachnellula suecica]|uniref:Sterol uptake control protein n=1 Tax=Lachnellula suecica TaxID=602035 RepID=A0A8T9BXZ9_9HELO|nr:Sterol uptake control protein [Lachnellula suecica]
MQRRSHKKSRQGCGECKKRHKKCDEFRPQCVNCTTANIKCSFAGNQSPDGDGYMISVGSAEATQSPRPQQAISTQAPGPEAAKAYVNLLHLELFNHWNSNSCKGFLSESTLPESLPLFLGYAFSSPFLMHETLAISALHLSTLRTDRAQFYQDESSKLQAEALRLFNESVTEVTDENLIPAFLFSATFGMHFLCGILSKPNPDLDYLFDGLVQSITILAGVIGVVWGRWADIVRSDVSSMLVIDDYEGEVDDEITQRFENLQGRIGKAPGLDSSQAKVLEDAVGDLILAYKLSYSADPATNRRMVRGVTTWLMKVSSGYSELVSQRQPEALVVLAYFAILLHRCRRLWTVRDAGRVLFDAVTLYLGNDWESWLEWPRSIVYRKD